MWDPRLPRSGHYHLLRNREGAPARECLNDRVTDDDRYLLAAIELAKRARDNGNHPFGALPVDADRNVVV